MHYIETTQAKELPYNAQALVRPALLLSEAFADAIKSKIDILTAWRSALSDSAFNQLKRECPQPP